MADEVKSGEAAAVEAAAVAPGTSAIVESPPAVERAVNSERDEARVRLVQLADAVRRTQNRRLLVEFLRLRRALR